jgi:hypothetical protein
MKKPKGNNQKGGNLMKKSLVTLSVLAAASSALASQVRFDALQQARTTRQDFVEMFAQPSVMWSGEVKDQVLFENNSGGVIRTDGEMRYGFYVGREPALISTPIWVTPTGLSNSTGLPVNLFYGRETGSIKWALNAFVASSKAEKAAVDFDKSAYGIAAGIDGGQWRVDAAIGLGINFNRKTPPVEETKGKANNRIQAEYDLNENWRLWVDYTQAEVEPAPNPTKKLTRTSVGGERRLGHGFFYGIRYDMTTVETGSKTETKSLPLYLGAEADVNDWLILRGVYSKPLTSSTTAGGNTSTNTFADVATVTGGAGLKLGSSLVDISTGVASGSGGFFTNVAYTYNF